MLKTRAPTRLSSTSHSTYRLGNSDAYIRDLLHCVRLDTMESKRKVIRLTNDVLLIVFDFYVGDDSATECPEERLRRTLLLARM